MALVSGCPPLASVSEAVKVNPTPIDLSQVVKLVTPAGDQKGEVITLQPLGQNPVKLT